MEEEEAGLVRRLQDQRVKVLKTKNIKKKFQTKERKKEMLIVCEHIYHITDSGKFA